MSEMVTILLDDDWGYVHRRPNGLGIELEGYFSIVEPALTLTVDRDELSWTYDPIDLFDLPSGEYLIVPVAEEGAPKGP